LEDPTKADQDQHYTDCEQNAVHQIKVVGLTRCAVTQIITPAMAKNPTSTFDAPSFGRFYGFFYFGA
jgi:hypothetical protein